MDIYFHFFQCYFGEHPGVYLANCTHGGLSSNYFDLSYSSTDVNLIGVNNSLICNNSFIECFVGIELRP
ncbi:MAG: hypothetical protein EAX86_11880 [Candidatus Heimdallarchaeota archaeon]|nr:hypothetical protein [Candidatus Heimdallarchaeota archaeon]